MRQPDPKQKHGMLLDLYARPEVGSILAVLAGLSFLFLCLLLPLVGKAGAEKPFARHNFFAFLGVLLFTLALCGVAIGSKMMRRRRDGSPPPVMALTLAGLCGLLFVALLAGLLAL